jgi:hypothetical protein
MLDFESYYYIDTNLTNKYVYMFSFVRMMNTTNYYEIFKVTNVWKYSRNMCLPQKYIWTKFCFSTI